MGRKAFFTENQIFEAADTLVAQGKEVTASALLTSLGGGSLTTIYKGLTAWKEARPATARASVPVEVPEPVQIAFLTAWKTAAAEAAREVAVAREKAAEEVKAANKQFQEALEQIERIETESEADAVKLSELEQRIGTLESDLQKAGQENAAMTATAEQLRHRVKSQEVELGRLHKDMEADKNRHQEEINRLVDKHTAAQDKAEAAQSKANEEIERLRGQFAESQKQAEQSERKRLEAETKIEAAQNQVKAAEDKQSQAVKEREQSVKESSELQGQVNALKEQNAELISRLGERKEKR
jgi:chromosome segregation ATPase